MGKTFFELDKEKMSFSSFLALKKISKKTSLPLAQTPKTFITKFSADLRVTVQIF